MATNKQTQGNTEVPVPDRMKFALTLAGATALGLVVGALAVLPLFLAAR